MKFLVGFNFLHDASAGLRNSGFSNAKLFADTIEDLAIVELGAAEVLGGDQDSEVGHYQVPFRNEKNGTVFPYLRVYTDVNGTIATGINYSAYVTK